VFVHHQLACMVFLVACLASKKFLNFLRKSLKEFGLNLKKKSCFKRSLRKKRKKDLSSHLSA
jgi:hypothetical protein